MVPCLKEVTVKLEKLYSKPERKVLDEILLGKTLSIASPFYSRTSVGLLDMENSERVSLITRLPDQYNMPTAFIENDPVPLKNLLHLHGNKLSLYALPTLHAKLFMNEDAVWMGSANFTLNGFCGKQEIVAKFSGNHGPWQKIFASYVKQSTRVTHADLEKLVRWIDCGLTRVNRTNIPDDDNQIEVPFSFEDFVDWLQKKNAPLADLRQHLFDRVNGKNFMSGHVRAGFNGSMAFLAANHQCMLTMLSAKPDSIPDTVLKEFSEFVRSHGDEYRGPQGGRWRNYLSTRLGGAQTGGGAGDIIVKRCLALIPRYLEDQRRNRTKAEH
jgi:hypothetical protein